MYESKFFRLLNKIKSKNTHYQLYTVINFS